jgi:hypothetical protein
MEPITPPLSGMPFPGVGTGMATPGWQQPQPPGSTAIPGAAPMAGFGGLMPPAQELQRAQCAALLQRLDAWLEATVPHMPQLAGVIPTTVLAVQLYAGGQYQASLAQAYGVVQTLSQMRTMYPALPPL